MTWWSEFLAGIKERAEAAAQETFDRWMTQTIIDQMSADAARQAGIPIGAIFHTDLGRTFRCIAYRQVRTGEFHYCHGSIHIQFGKADADFFPGIEAHVCHILQEIQPSSRHYTPPPPPTPKPDRELWRALRSLGFKKKDGRPEPDQVRARYLELAKRYHPDRNPRGAERMKQITEAYRNYQELAGQ